MKLLLLFIIAALALLPALNSRKFQLYSTQFMHGVKGSLVDAKWPRLVTRHLSRVTRHLRPTQVVHFANAEILVNSLEAPEKTTAKFYWQPTGESGYINCGNVLDYKPAFKNELKQRYKSTNGRRILVNEMADKIDLAWEFTLDEQHDLNIRLLQWASKGAAVVQAPIVAPAGTFTFTNLKQGRHFFLPHNMVNTVVMTTKVEGTDFTWEQNGAVYIIPGGGIADGISNGGTYGSAGYTSNLYTMLAYRRFTGNVIIEEHNEHSTAGMALKRFTFLGVLNCIDWPEQSGEVGKFKFRVVATNTPTFVKRHELT